MGGYEVWGTPIVPLHCPVVELGEALRRPRAPPSLLPWDHQRMASISRIGCYFWNTPYDSSPYTFTPMVAFTRPAVYGCL